MKGAIASLSRPASASATPSSRKPRPLQPRMLEENSRWRRVQERFAEGCIAVDTNRPRHHDGSRRNFLTASPVTSPRSPGRTSSSSPPGSPSPLSMRPSTPVGPVSPKPWPLCHLSPLDLRPMAPPPLSRRPSRAAAADVWAAPHHPALEPILRPPSSKDQRRLSLGANPMGEAPSFGSPGYVRSRRASLRRLPDAF